MSLINQVLNQLEQRGAHTAPDQTQVRAVPALPRREWIKPLLLTVGLLALIGLGAVIWAKRSDKQVPEVNTTHVPVQPVQEVVKKDESPEGPATRLSYELSVPPLPDALREKESEADMAPQRPLVANIVTEAPRVSRPADVLAPQPPVITRHEAPLPVKQISPKQRADGEYRKGLQAQQQGKLPEAMSAYEAALRDDRQHEAARLAMATLLLENGSQAAAERLLREGLSMKPVRLSLAVALARMQVGRDQLDLAVETLQAHLAAADNNADYHSFYAALLQRQSRHDEAVNHYQIALQVSPRNGVWRVGYAISLQALGRIEDAKLAYKQALATRTLTPELTAFVEQKLAAL